MVRIESVIVNNLIGAPIWVAFVRVLVVFEAETGFSVLFFKSATQRLVKVFLFKGEIILWLIIFKVQCADTGNIAKIGDGFCDDKNNNKECNYDGGDCCGSCKVTDFCTNCTCLQDAG